ncbi:FAD/NAD(P)-binding domain-containing protein [Zymoseptoria brevis]|uniref:FAD/NAD(P)-binding domain-containing protein n=1 Tax=Zymoseptoria brevis TaxID=1047168 RepID=A0A0F4GBK4_9PEZI|nr:FAD/NAD(P)-binding domain-containing protein [Zymoseptoria brevis]
MDLKICVLQPWAWNPAVIGAGVSGIATAVHLHRAGLDVIVYERNAKAGGIWIYDERTWKDAAYPSVLPSVGDSPEFLTAARKRKQRQDSPLNDGEAKSDKKETEDEDFEDVSLSFAPPGPCYNSLTNNVSTIEMELSCQKFNEGTAEFTQHPVFAEVNLVEKTGEKWRVDVSTLTRDGSKAVLEDSSSIFDAVVVANGNYHAVNIPDIPGLAEWKKSFPERVRHSKLYRTPDEFKGQNVLIIGAGVSSADLAREVGAVANAVLRSSRGGQYDLPSAILPDNGASIAQVQNFGVLNSSELAADGTIPGSFTLESGETICGIHQVILATGYHVSLPFLPQYHADGVEPEEADEEILITDGRQTHNLHEDIWYIPDPSLAFIGVPYHIATWSLYEYQAKALAATWSGRSSLPSKQEMREEYIARLKAKGPGRPFHSLKALNAEPEYCE